MFTSVLLRSGPANTLHLSNRTTHTHTHTGSQMSHLGTVCSHTTVGAAVVIRDRDGRLRHLAWVDPWQETDVMDETSSTDEREEKSSSQMTDFESAVDCRPDSPTAGEVMALPSTAPVMGESFCLCSRQEDFNPVPSSDFGATGECLCGEEDQDFSWMWDEHWKSTGALLSCDNRKVNFHSDYSCGTAAIRGTKELTDGQHYWEVKMTSPVYGTDMMVGVGTSEVNLEKFRYNFGSLLGHDEDSWGLSYTGLLQHKGDKVKFSSRFGQGSIIGVHLDTWHGTLTFYKNRHCIGVAATKLRNKKLFPMVCSTAAKSSMKIIRACHTPTSLQYLCSTRLRQMLPSCPDVLNTLKLPPGLHLLLQIKLGWVFTLSGSSSEMTEQQTDSPEVYPEEMSLPPSPSISPIPGPLFDLSAYASLSPCSSPLPDTVPFDCPYQMSHDLNACRCPSTPPSSDNDSWSSEPEDYQCKRCRWT